MRRVWNKLREKAVLDTTADSNKSLDDKTKKNLSDVVDYFKSYMRGFAGTKSVAQRDRMDAASPMEMANSLVEGCITKCATANCPHSVCASDDGDGLSMVSMAASAGYFDLVKILLNKNNMKPDDRGPKGDCTPLMEAASAGHIEIMDLLIKRGADVNAHSSVGSLGNTPLIYACAAGNIEAVKLLLDSGALIDLCNDNGQTPLMEAAAAGHLDVAKLLVERGARVSFQFAELKVGLESPLTLACYKGHVEMVKFLLEVGFCNSSSSCREEELHTALMEASMDGHVEVAKLLLDAGAQVNLTADSFESPLTLAACGGHVELAKLLLSNGARLDEINEEGYTPLMEAAREGHLEMVELLIQRGADVNAITSETGETALTVASALNFKHVVAYLVSKGADINLGMSTPLMEASQEGNADIVAYLINQGADLNLLTTVNETALSYAADGGHIKICKMLIDCGAKVNLVGETGRTPLMKAAAAGHQDVVEYLLLFGADVNAMNANREHTALSLACAAGHLNIVEVLLSYGANSNVILKDGSTCIIEATRNGHASVVEYLVGGTAKGSARLTQASSRTTGKGTTAWKAIPTPVPPPSDTDTYPLLSPCHVANDEVTLDMMTVEQKLKIEITESVGNGPAAAGSGVMLKEAELAAAMQELENLKRTQKMYEDLQSSMVSCRQEATADLPDSTATETTTVVDGSLLPDVKQQPICTGCVNCSSRIEVRHQHINVVLPLMQQCTGSQQRDATTGKAAVITRPPVSISMVNKMVAETAALIRRNDANSVISVLPSGNGVCIYGNAEKQQQNVVVQANASAPEACMTTVNSVPVVASVASTASLVTDTVTTRVAACGQQNGYNRQQVPPPQSIPFLAGDRQQSTSVSKASAVPFVQDLNRQTESTHDTALTLACAGGHEDLVLLLLKHGADIEHRDKRGYTPLIVAANSGHKRIVEILISKGANLEAQTDRNKETALSIACQMGRRDLAELLLKRGAFDQHRNASCHTPLCMAAVGGFVDVMELFVQRGTPVDDRKDTKTEATPLMLAAMNGNAQAVQYLIDHCADVNAQIDSTRNTPLTFACHHGKTEAVKVLVKHRANLEHKTLAGMTPLMEAASGNYLEMGQVLLEAGADPSALSISTSRNTSLTIASEKGHADFVKLLLDHKAQVDSRTKKGFTALWLAANGNHLECVRHLLNAGADANMPDNRRITPLMAAFMKGNVEVVKLLVEHVNQFPSDLEMSRYISSLQKKDKELMAKCEEVMKIITPTKDRHAIEASKIADGLLKEIEVEKQLAETKRQAKLRKKEKNRQKKLKKKAQQQTADEELAQAEKGQRRGKTKETVTGRRVPSCSASSSSCSSRSADDDDVEEKGTVDPGARADVDLPLSDSGQLDETTSRSSESDFIPVGRVTIRSRPNEPQPERKVRRRRTYRTTKLTSASLAAVEPSVGQSKPPTKSTTIIDRDNSSGSTDEKLASRGSRGKTAVPRKVDESTTSDQSNASLSCRDIRRQPYKLLVAAQAIARVIGRGGQNINAIRDASNAHIEVEKNQKSHTDRLITIRGTPDAVQLAVTMINGLIKDPDSHVTTVINVIKSRGRKVLDSHHPVVVNKLVNASSSNVSNRTGSAKTTMTDGSVGSASVADFPEISMWIPTSAPMAGRKTPPADVGTWPSSSSHKSHMASALEAGLVTRQRANQRSLVDSSVELDTKRPVGYNSNGKKSSDRLHERSGNDELTKVEASIVSATAAAAAATAQESNLCGGGFGAAQSRVDDGRHSAQAKATVACSGLSHADFVPPKSVQRPASATAVFDPSWTSSSLLVDSGSQEGVNSTTIGTPSASVSYPMPIGIERKLKASGAAISTNHLVSPSYVESCGYAMSGVTAGRMSELCPPESLWNNGSCRSAAESAFNGPQCQLETPMNHLCLDVSDSEWPNSFESRFPNSEWQLYSQRLEPVTLGSRPFHEGYANSMEVPSNIDQRSSLYQKQSLLFGSRSQPPLVNQYRTNCSTSKLPSTYTGTHNSNMPMYYANSLQQQQPASLIAERTVKPMIPTGASMAPYGCDPMLSSSAMRNVPTDIGFSMPAGTRLSHRTGAATNPWSAAAVHPPEQWAPSIGDWKMTSGYPAPAGSVHIPQSQSGWSGWNKPPPM